MHAVNGLAVGGVLLFLIGQLAASPHEQKLATKQAYPHGTGLDRTFGVIWHFNVGQKFDALTVHRQGWRVLEPVQALALQISLALLEAVFSKDDGRRVNNQNTCVTVNDDPVVLLDQLASAPCPHYSRNIQAARDDCSM